MDFIAQPSKGSPLRLLGLLLIFQLAYGFVLSATFGNRPEIPPATLSDTSIVSQTPQENTQSQTLPSETEPDSEPINILLIGQDRSEGDDRTRSDTIILCTFRKSRHSLVMTSFLRDLYVEIPGHGKNRINAAYIYGGMPLLNQTLEENFGIKIDGNLEVDFSGFTKIIDTLGGVSIELRQDEAEAINLSTSRTLTEGTQLLTGTEALAYARIRKLDSDGDFSRTARQRKLLASVLNACKDSSFPTLLKLTKQLLPTVNSDIPNKELLSMALDVLPELSELNIQGQQIPQEGAYSYQTIRGMSVLVPDIAAARQFLEETLYGAASP